jgi:hypothetical protein
LGANIFDGIPVLSDALGCSFSMEVVIAVEESATPGEPVAVIGK